MPRFWCDIKEGVGNDGVPYYVQHINGAKAATTRHSLNIDGKMVDKKTDKLLRQKMRRN